MKYKNISGRNLYLVGFGEAKKDETVEIKGTVNLNFKNWKKVEIKESNKKKKAKK